MGMPGTGSPWGWQFEGHHLTINWLDDGERVSIAPLFVGGEAVDVTEGPFAGSRVLQEQQDLGLGLLLALTPAQRARAVLASTKDGDDMLAGAGGDNRVIAPAGLPAVDMTGAQREALVALVRSYVGTFRSEVADATMADFIDALDATHFAWIGGDGPDAVFYYRVQSPVLLVEFDHQNPVWTTATEPRGRPTRQHIHAVLRTPNGRDYGRDLLRAHLEAQAH